MKFKSSGKIKASRAVDLDNPARQKEICKKIIKSFDCVSEKNIVENCLEH